MSSSRDPADPFLAIINPAAGGGRCGTRAASALALLRQAGIKVEERETEKPRDAVRIVREAYEDGYRKFLAVGGDGTCWEVLNGIAPHGLAPEAEPPASLGVLPLGTGNSFLREFTEDGAEYSIGALVEGRRRRCDVLRLTHAEGRVYFINLLGFGFSADVTFHTQRGRYKRFGDVGYILGILYTIVHLHHPKLAMRVDGGELESKPMTFFCVCNSRYTAGAMLMAPAASVSDGRADLIRVEPIGRFDIVRTFPKIYRGTHVQHPAVSARTASRIDFEATETARVMVDGEILEIVPRSIEVLPGALEVWA